MRGSSQPSYEAVAQAFEPVLRTAGADASDLGAQLFSVVDALDGSGSLRRAVTNPARSGDDKSALVGGLLAGKVDDRVVSAVQALARSRWSREADLLDAVEQLAANAVLAAAEAEGALEHVEDELFRLDRVLVGQRELRQAFTDRRAEPRNRRALVRDLLGSGQVHRITLQLVERVAGMPRGRSLPASLSLLSGLAAARRRMVVADVTAAAPLTQAQVVRLTQILERAYDRPVTVQVGVEPEVVGGLRVQVGSDVVDATVLARLDDVRRRLAG